MILTKICILGLLSLPADQDTLSTQPYANADSSVVVVGYSMMTPTIHQILNGTWLVENDEYYRYVNFLHGGVMVFSDKSGLQKGQETNRYTIINRSKNPAEKEETPDFQLEVYTNDSLNEIKGNQRVFDVYIHNKEYIMLKLHNTEFVLKKQDGLKYL